MYMIDFHTHIFAPDVIAARETYLKRDRWFGLLYANPRTPLACAEQLVASMDKAGVDAAVVFGFAFADPGLCHMGNAYVLEAAARFPGRLIPFVTMNCRYPESVQREIQEGLERGAAGIGELMPDSQGYGLTDFTLLTPLMDLAHQHQLPVMLHVNEQVGHLYAGKGTQGPAEAYRLAVQYPENVIVFSHWGGGLPFYELMPEVRAALRNVYYDTAASPFLYEDTIFQHVAAWAPHKVLWGTDYPLLKHAPFLRRIRRIGIAPDALAGILGGNARAVLRQPTLREARE